MEKFSKCGSYGNFWQLFQNISGLMFVSPDIPALKYGGSMGVNAVNLFCDLFSENSFWITPYQLLARWYG